MHLFAGQHDGYIARHYNQITDFGKFVDPLADKLLVCAALLLFIQRSEMNSVMVFIILAREFIITSLRIVAIGKGRVLAAAWSGKVKTTLQIVAPPPFSSPTSWAGPWWCRR